MSDSKRPGDQPQVEEGMHDQFKLSAMNIDQVVAMVNLAGQRITQGRAGDLGIINEAIDQGLGTHEGRKKFLKEKLGIDENTPKETQIVIYRNQEGQVQLFKGTMDDGHTKLTLTDAVTVPQEALKQNKAALDQLIETGFKPIGKPIEVKIDDAEKTPDGLDLKISDDEKRKLETQSTFAAALHRSGDVQLTSNSRLPGRQEISGLVLAS